MKRVTFDKERFSAAGLTTLPPQDGVIVIVLPGQQDMVRCKIVDDQIEFYPERSSLQKAALKALGVR